MAEAVVAMLDSDDQRVVALGEHNQPATVVRSGHNNIWLKRSLAANTQEHGAVAVEEGVVDEVALGPRLRGQRVEVVHQLLAVPGL